MGVVYKVLGQSAPAATTETALYTVPAATATIVSTITVCNRGSTEDYFNLSVSVGGGATAITDYVYFSVFVLPHDTFAATIGITMGATDVMRIVSTGGNLTFSLFGQETS